MILYPIIHLVDGDKEEAAKALKVMTLSWVLSPFIASGIVLILMWGLGV